jgi:hypothetical protein
LLEIFNIEKKSDENLFTKNELLKLAEKFVYFYFIFQKKIFFLFKELCDVLQD